MLRNQLTVHAASARAVEPGNRWQRVKFVVAAAVTVSAVAACQSAGPKAAPTGTPSATEATTSATAWRGEYNAEELALYDEAVQRVAVYQQKEAAIFSRGKYTKAAEEFFQDNLLSWRLLVQRLKQFESANVKFERPPKVLSSTAKSINVSDGGVVELRQCVDLSDQGATQDGAPTSPLFGGHPVIQASDVNKYPDGRWRIGVINVTDELCGD